MAANLSRARDWLASTWSGLIHFRGITSAWAPRRVMFLDGVSRVVSRSLAKELWILEDNPLLAQEAALAVEHYRGGDFLDVGAHHGMYLTALAPFAEKGSHLISFEPDQVPYELLLHNVATLARTFPESKFAALPFAVGDGGTIKIASPNPWHRSYQSQAAGPADANQPRTVTVDQMVAAMGLRPELLKIDVEGAEYGVICGARETLRKFRPVVILELHLTWLPKGVTPEMCQSALTELGYRERLLEESVAIKRLLYQVPV
jgi:FkbM family methyltransferase